MMRKAIDLFIITLGYTLLYEVVFNELEITGINAALIIGNILASFYLTNLYIKKVQEKVIKFIEKTEKKEEKAEDTATEKA